MQIKKKVDEVLNHKKSSTFSVFQGGLTVNSILIFFIINLNLQFILLCPPLSKASYYLY